MSKGVLSPGGQGSEPAGALLAPQRSDEHPEVRSVTTGEPRVLFRPTAASSWGCSSSFSRHKDLFLDRLAGNSRTDGEFTPPAGDELPRCASTRRRERQSRLDGEWRRTKSSARRFAIPLVFFGYRFRSFRTCAHRSCLASSRKCAQPIGGDQRRTDPPFFRWRARSKWRVRRVCFFFSMQTLLTVEQNKMENRTKSNLGGGE